MAGKEVFTVDAAAFKSAAASTRIMGKGIADTKQHLALIEKSLSGVALSQAKMGAAGLVYSADAVEQLKAIKDSLTATATEKKKIADSTKKEVTDYSKLSMLDKMRVKLAERRFEKQTKTVQVGKKQIQLQTMSNKLNEAADKAWRGTGKRIAGAARGVAGYATSMTGVQFSLVGILALLLKIFNEGNKIGAMSQQITAQWGKSATGISTAKKTMSGLRNDFWMSVEAAGALATSIARAGIEEKDIKELSEDLVASEFKYGAAVQENLGMIKQLGENYGIANMAASGLLTNVRETSKTVPYLSMAEATQDMIELSNLTRSYNTDLLGTLALYNTLINKKVAEKLGLGDAPKAVRKEIIRTVAGFSKELADGWKAALGEGTTAAAKILDFEKLLPAEQFARMAEFVTEKTAGMMGDTREIATRQLLKQLGFSSTEVQKTLAKAFVGSGFSAEGLKDVMATIGEQQDLLKEAEKKAPLQRAELLTAAKKIASGLTTFEDKLMRKIANVVRASEGWAELQPKFQKAAEWLVKEIPDLLASMIGGIADVVKWIEKVAYILGEEEERKGGERAVISGKYAGAGEAIGKEVREGGYGRLGPILAEAMKHIEPKKVKGYLGQLGIAPEQIKAMEKFGPGHTQKLWANMMLSLIEKTEKTRVVGYKGMNELEALMQAVSEGQSFHVLMMLKDQMKEKSQVISQVQQMKGLYRKTDVGLFTGPTAKAEAAIAASALKGFQVK